MIQEIPPYLNSYHQFEHHRLDYYSDNAPISIQRVLERIYPKQLSITESGLAVISARHEAIDQMRQSQSSDVVIITAAKNRLHYLPEAYDALLRQEANVRWQWVVVDNLSTDGTEEYIQGLQQEDRRVFYVPLIETTGCASPTRNMGLDMVHAAYYLQPNAPRFVMVIDSDDRLHDSRSLYEVTNADENINGKNRENALLHGFCESHITDSYGNIIYVPNPRDFGSDHPRINGLVEFYDKGLNLLSGIFPIELLSWLRYPAEFSFEDDGMNQKLILQAIKKHMKWTGIPYPITIKRFHNESMSGSNNMVGDTAEVNKIGLHKVTGIRARIVQYLKELTDYYQREEL